MKRGRQVRLFVLIDALGWRFLEGRDFLTDLLPYRTPVRTVLGFSSGAVPAILTGLSPAQNGHWNLFYYDPEGSPFRWLRHFGFLPDRVLNHQVTRKLLKELGRHVLGLGPLFECYVNPSLLPWFNWGERKNFYEAGGMAGARTIFDHLSASGIPYRVYTYHHHRDSEIVRRAIRDVENSDAVFFFLYLSELDGFLHEHCGDAAAIEERLQRYARWLRQLAAVAQRVSADGSLTVFSDHGMTPVTHHFDVVREVESLGLREPSDYLAIYDSTMARFWFFNAEAKRRMSTLLQTLPCGRILSEGELRGLGVFFADRRYGELVFLMHVGWLIARSNFSGQWLPVGMHGYHPDDPYSDAVFLSDREPPVPVSTLMDVYQCMRMALEEDSSSTREQALRIREAGD